MRQSLPPPTEDVPLTVIGVVRSAHTEPENTPIQAALNRAGRGTIEIAEPPRGAAPAPRSGDTDAATMLTTAWLRHPAVPAAVVGARNPYLSDPTRPLALPTAGAVPASCCPVTLAPSRPLFTLTVRQAGQNTPEMRTSRVKSQRWAMIDGTHGAGGANNP
jgi:hypothetical protein